MTHIAQTVMPHVYALDHVQIAMPTHGEPAARRFYGDLLGLKELSKPPNLAARGGLWFQCGPLQVHLGVEADFRPAGKAHPAFLVHDLAKVREALDTAGHTVTLDPEPSPGVERIFTTDPFGNRIELVQPHSS
jgi:catechol 2,3-dioxygenase-like lactoylglutathione lyase family enzyme